MATKPPKPPHTPPVCLSPAAFAPKGHGGGERCVCGLVLKHSVSKLFLLFFFVVDFGRGVSLHRICQKLSFMIEAWVFERKNKEDIFFVF